MLEWETLSFNQIMSPSRKNHDLRTCGINPNHWYVVAQSSQIGTQPMAVTLWGQSIVIYRTQDGVIHALEDYCPHRQVKLSVGRVIEDHLECAYHGWRFNQQGNCTFVPYLTDKQKLPNCAIRTYPVRELDGFIWLFPGDEQKLAQQAIAPMGVPEWEHLNYIGSVALIDCPGHYSFLIENLMDMYHGHLHDNYQAWASAQLRDVTTDDYSVNAHYEAQSYYKIDKIWSISQLFFPALRCLHPEPLNVSYIYPHWRANLGEDFKLYCLLCPVNETHTKAYLIHFTSLEAFPDLHKLPVWFRRFLKNTLSGTAKGILEGLVRQDVEMIIQEQEAYHKNPQRKTYELNPTVSKVQKLIEKQYQQSLLD